MLTQFELLQVAHLIKLAAETAAACAKVEANGEMARITEVALRIKAAAEELEEISRSMESKGSDGGD